MDKDELDGYTYALEKFKDYMAGKMPKTIIIERQLVLMNALKEAFPESKVLFDPWHLHKSLMKQFGEHKDELVKNLPNLPLEQNIKTFNDEIAKLKKHKFSEDFAKSLINKLVDEKELWSLAYHKNHFTGGVCVCQRNELLKTHMKSFMIQRNYTVADGFSKLIGLNEKEFKYSEEYSSIDGKYNNVFQKIPLIATFAKTYLTNYGYQRLKYEVAKAMKFEIVTEKETDNYEALSKENSWKIRSKGTTNLEAKIYE